MTTRNRQLAGELLARSLPLSAVLFLLILVFALFAPRADLPINDEWCYVHLAKTFIANGKIKLGGCSIALGFPTYAVSAPFVRLFSPSFFVLRASILVFALTASVFMYLLSRRLGNGRGRSAFATAMVMLSPVALPNVLTYMTDVPALALLLGASYLGYRAVEDIELGRTRYLLAALFLYVGGILVRQFVVVYAVVFFITVALLTRRRQRLFYVSVVCCAAVVFTTIGAQYWAEHRIDRVWGVSSSLASLRARIHVRPLAGDFMRVGATLLVLLLPATVVASSVPAVSDTSSTRRRSLLLLCLAVFVGVTWKGWPFPQLGNLVTEYGFLYPRRMGFGDRPVVLTTAVRWMISAAAVTFAVLTFRMVVDQCETLTSSLGRYLRDLSTIKPSTFFFTVNALATVAYLLIIESRVSTFLGDRYLLLCLPFSVLLLVQIGNRSGWLAYGLSGVAVLVFAAFSLASLHDYVNEQAGRRAVFERLVARGFPQNQIVIGLEQDFWREIETRGFVDYRFNNPWYSPTWSYQQSRAISLLPMPQVAVLVGPAPGVVAMGVEPVCFRSFLARGSTCVYASSLSHEVSDR